MRSHHVLIVSAAVVGCANTPDVLSNECRDCTHNISVCQFDTEVGLKSNRWLEGGRHGGQISGLDSQALCARRSRSDPCAATCARARRGTSEEGVLSRGWPETTAKRPLLGLGSLAEEPAHRFKSPRPCRRAMPFSRPSHVGCHQPNGWRIP